MRQRVHSGCEDRRVVGSGQSVQWWLPAEDQGIACQALSGAGTDDNNGSTSPLARNRSRAYDSEGQSEVGGEGGCNRAGHFHCRAVWHRRVTPKSIEQPRSPSAHVQTEFRNETRDGVSFRPWAVEADFQNAAGAVVIQMFVAKTTLR